MDGPRFDAWTRRRFGLAAGGALASLIGMNKTSATKQGKRRGKRCNKLGAGCKPGGKRKCDATGFASELPKVCCKIRGKPCGDERDCCDGLGCCGSPLVCSASCISDRARKDNFGSVNPVDMLERVRFLPISTWNYTSDDPSIRHIGPMAQDFAATFGVGADDRHIHPLDGQGVAMAAIQGLADLVTELREENARLAARVDTLEKGGN